jgi:hypothetical protein
MPWSLRKHISAIRSLRSGACGCTHTDTSLQQLWETTTNRFWETTMNRFIIMRPLASAAVLAVAALGVAPAFAAQPQASASSLSRTSPMALSMPSVFQGTVGGGHRAHRTSASKPAAASTPTACPTSTPGRARRARRSKTSCSPHAPSAPSTRCSTGRKAKTGSRRGRTCGAATPPRATPSPTGARTRAA